MNLKILILTSAACVFLAAGSGFTEDPANVSGSWKMTFQKRDGGKSLKLLTLQQNGQSLQGTIKDEGGELAVAGEIQNGKLHLEGHHRVTITVEATLDKANSDRMSGTFNVLSIHRTWTGERQK